MFNFNIKILLLVCLPLCSYVGVEKYCGCHTYRKSEFHRAADNNVNRSGGGERGCLFVLEVVYTHVDSRLSRMCTNAGTLATSKSSERQSHLT